MLSESKGMRYSNCSIKFKYNNEDLEFKSDNTKNLFKDVVDWLYKSGYKFNGTIHSGSSTKILSEKEVDDIVSKTSFEKRMFYNILRSGNYIAFNSKVKQLYGFLSNMLINFGVQSDTIETHFESDESEIEPFKYFISNSEKVEDEDEVTEKTTIAKKTWLNATIDYLKSIGNKPQTVEEIWSAISGQVKTSGKTPLDSLRVMITHHYPTNFETIEGRPRKYKLSEMNSEIINDVDKVEKIKIFSKNPFRQSICVLGDSGAGKSTTLEHILEFEGHEFEFIIPSASTTGLLSQFSPSKSGYIKSRLGKMIVKAFNNPTTLYTAVFDECHKSNVIEMINDELLQAISTKRNMGRRFISLDEDTSELYKGVETFRGNILIPDNFGFIFISSKPRIISNNTDFFNRVDLVVLSEADREMKTSEELLSKVLPEEEKMKLASTRND
jgi:hypothetical protein